MGKNKINERARGTVASILNYYFSKNLEVPFEILENIDFKEVIFKRIETPEYKYSNFQDIEESNIINCIKTIPFEAYVKYIDLDLILDKGKDERGVKAISIAIADSNFKLLEHIYSLVENCVNDGEITKNIGNRDLEEMFFSQALDLNNLLRLSNDRNDSLANKVKKYDFFKKSVTLFNKYYNDKSKNWGGSQEHNFENWHENYSRLQTILSRKTDENLLNNLLVANKSLVFILKDIFKLYDGKENIFATSDYASIALKNSNFDFLDLVVASKAELNPFKNGLIRYFNKLSTELTNNYENGKLNYLGDVNIEKTYTYYKEHNLPFELNQDAIKVLLAKPNQEGFEFLKKFVTKDTVVSDTTTLGQMSYMYKLCEILSGYSKETNLSINLKDTTFHTYLNLQANTLLGNYEPTIEEKHSTIAHFSNNLGLYFTVWSPGLFQQEIKSILTKEVLKEDLKINKETVLKKMKL